MISIRRQLLGLGFAAASSLVAMQAAHALTGPTAITIDGGPLGQLSLSGGADGYGFYNNNAVAGAKDKGIYMGDGMVELQKTTGVLQFTIEVGSVGGAIVLGGTQPFSQTSVNFFRTGPLYLGYVTIAPPNSPVTLSAGHLASLEGYESTINWVNPSQFVTSIFAVQNSSSTGVQLNGTEGPVSASVQFGDGNDTGVWNYGQALVTYTIDSNNVANVYGAMNFGRTGPHAFYYGGNTVGTGPTSNAIFTNNWMVGGFYSWTGADLFQKGDSLNVIPEVQYVFAKTDHIMGLDKSTSNFGAAVFGTYAFANTPYSLGGWVEYENSQGAGFWFAGPNSEAVGAALSPTWQYKYLFARANVGLLYLLNNKQFSTSSYNNDGTGKLQFLSTLQAGVLF
ncbi:MAG TPA: outer membrane beta-barrel protein [Acidocella sp.]|jgi:hypothetical protein|nr:outer membrane beta-barrel protein [Acidocella sp.]